MIASLNPTVKFGSYVVRDTPENRKAAEAKGNVCIARPNIGLDHGDMLVLESGTWQNNTHVGIGTHSEVDLYRDFQRKLGEALVTGYFGMGNLPHQFHEFLRKAVEGAHVGDPDASETDTGN